jgi:hypothetical protein
MSFLVTVAYELIGVLTIEGWLSQYRGTEFKSYLP